MFFAKGNNPVESMGMFFEINVDRPLFKQKYIIVINKRI